MAELSAAVLSEDYSTEKGNKKLVSIRVFRQDYAGNVTPQAIDYAMKKGKVDWALICPGVRVIVLTAHTLSYKPNSNYKRKRALRTTLRT